MNPELPMPAEYRAEQAWPQLLTLIADAATALNRAEVAGALDIRLSSLNNILTDRDRHSLKARQLLYFILRDDRVIRWLANFAGFKLEKKRPLSPEEELLELRARVRSEFGAAGERVLSEVGR